MSYLLIVIITVISIFFPAAFWLIIIAVCAGIAWFWIRMQEKAREENEKQNELWDDTSE